MNADLGPVILGSGMIEATKAFLDVSDYNSARELADENVLD